jgi:fructose-1,6-bisphosphatase
MRAQYEAQPHNANKRQKNNNNQSKSGGDLHVLIATFNDVKARIEKELKQRSTACGKRKAVSFAEDVVVEKDDNKKNKKIDSNNIKKNIAENFSSELEELTLSDVSDGDFEVLSELSDISEIE